MTIKLIIIFYISFLPIISLAEAYSTAYSSNNDLCKSFKLNLENKDTHKSINYLYWEIMPNKHVNESINIENNVCYFHEVTESDINNDNKMEYLLRNTGCLSGIPSHNLYIYRDNIKNMNNFFNSTKTLAQINLTGSFYNLTKLPKVELRGQFSGKSVYPAIGGMFKIEPFIYKNDIFISISTTGKSSNDENTWHVVTKFMPSNELQDQCYYRTTR